jgi:hypothetical protein
MASRTKDRAAQKAFVELDRQWQEIARQKEDMERHRS